LSVESIEAFQHSIIKAFRNIAFLAVKELEEGKMLFHRDTLSYTESHREIKSF